MKFHPTRRRTFGFRPQGFRPGSLWTILTITQSLEITVDNSNDNSVSLGDTIVLSQDLNTDITGAYSFSSGISIGSYAAIWVEGNPHIGECPTPYWPSPTETEWSA